MPKDFSKIFHVIFLFYLSHLPYYYIILNCILLSANDTNGYSFFIEKKRKVQNMTLVRFADSFYSNLLT